jgi:hypothetical protein
VKFRPEISSICASLRSGSRTGDQFDGFTAIRDVLAGAQLGALARFDAPSTRTFPASISACA